MLPDAEWRKDSSLAHIIAALADNLGGPLAVGGAVRDTLLGEAVTDIDLATPLHPDEVSKRLTAAGIKAIPTGLDHGTITAVADNHSYEITTLRRDVATDGRRATVAFADNWREDAERRDFTFNALYANPTSGEILDYFGGIDDLENGVVRFIGDAAQRIAEDHLRILRYFRFLARFGDGEVNEEALTACANAAHSMTALSRERIAQELLKTLSARHAAPTVALMQEYGIFAPFLPEVREDAGQSVQRLTRREAAHGIAPSLQARLLAILPTDRKAVDKVAARLKLSNRMREGLAVRLVALPTAANIRAFAYRSGIDAARDSAMVFAGDNEIAACIAALDGWELPAFQIKGGDLITRGISAGPLVARTLRAVKAQWIEEGFPAVPRQREIADQLAESALLASKNA